MPTLLNKYLLYEWGETITNSNRNKMLKENMKIFSRTSDLIINLNLKETNNISKAVRKKAGSNGKTKPPLILKPIWFWSLIFFFCSIYLFATHLHRYTHARQGTWVENWSTFGRWFSPSLCRPQWLNSGC